MYCLFVWYGTDYICMPIPFNCRAVMMKIRSIFQLILAVDFMHLHEGQDLILQGQGRCFRDSKVNATNYTAKVKVKS